MKAWDRLPFVVQLALTALGGIAAFLAGFCAVTLINGP